MAKLLLHALAGLIFTCFSAKAYGQTVDNWGFNGIKSAQSSTNTQAPGKFLVFYYGAYDQNYPVTMEALIRQEMPGAAVSDFFYGTPTELEHALKGVHAMIVPYTAFDEMETIPNYSVVLNNYVQNGGTIIFSGTHLIENMANFGFLKPLAATFYTPVTVVDQISKSHPITEGIPAAFNITNYGYTIRIDDPAFVALAHINRECVAGYKLSGKGKIVYLGFEYYVDEEVPTKMLANTLKWTIPTLKYLPISYSSSAKMDSEQAASAENDVLLSVYPNPFAGKSTIELNLRASMDITVEISDETGRLVAVPARNKSTSQGINTIDFPNVKPGVYFVKCISGEFSVVKKVVKVITP